MTASHPSHVLRSLLIATVGLTIAGVSTIALLLSLRSTSARTLSLAYRVDAKRTVAFVRAIDQRTLREKMTLVTPTAVSETLPTVGSLPQGTSYEFALLKDTGALLSWIIYIHTSDQHHTTIVSKNDPSLFLPIADIRKSLGTSTFLQENNERTMSELTYVDLSLLPALDIGSSALIRSALSPFTQILFLQKGKESTWVLKKKEKNVLFPTYRPSMNVPALPAPFVQLTSNDPLGLASTFGKALNAENSGVAEGISGILQHLLSTAVHQTNLEEVGNDVLSNGASLALLPDGHSFHLLLSGQARTNALLENWVRNAAIGGAAGRIRTQRFSKVNSRTDVIRLPQTNARRDSNGWTVTPLGASGGSLSFTVATKGNRFVLSDDVQIIHIATNFLDHAIRQENAVPRFLEGTIEVQWLLQKMSDTLPFLQNDMQAIKRALGIDITHIHWSAIDESSTVKIRTRAEKM